MTVDVWKKHIAREWKAFDTYKVTILLEDIVGGKPATEEMIAKWVEATCKKASDDERQKIRDAHVDQLPDVVDAKAAKQAVVFARVDGELVIEGRQVKAMLKEAGNIIKDIAPGDAKGGKENYEGVKRLRSKVADQTFVVERYISLGRTEPDEVDERPIHVLTALGPRDSIKRSEICYDVEISFTIQRRAGKGLGVPEKTLMAILDYAQQVGLGADRSQGRGCFKVQSVEKTNG